MQTDIYDYQTGPSTEVPRNSFNPRPRPDAQALNSGQSRRDIPFLLFLVPFVLSGVYALYLWVSTGISPVLPSSVFLEVTESPYVFIVGFLAVIAGASMDIIQAEPSARRATLESESSALQKIALAALVLGGLSAWYSAGFDPGAAATNFLDGRYVIVFPALLILFSFLFLPAVAIRGVRLRNAVVVVLLLGVPLSVHEVGKLNFFAGMASGLVLLAIALYLYLSGRPSG